VRAQPAETAVAWHVTKQPVQSASADTIPWWIPACHAYLTVIPVHRQPYAINASRATPTLTSAASSTISTPLAPASALLAALSVLLSAEPPTAPSSMTVIPLAVTQSSSNATLPAKLALQTTPICVSAVTRVYLITESAHPASTPTVMSALKTRSLALLASQPSP
jgi:hypothetical protein